MNGFPSADEMMASMDEYPLVSVCIPAYNAAPFIAEAIESVVTQTYRNWELLIIENCSNDGTSEVIQRLATELSDSRISVFRNESRLGMAENWNEALSYAHGKFIKLLCADDLLYPTCLETQVKILIEHPTVTLAAGARTVINAQGKRLFTRCGIQREGVYPGRDMIPRCLMSGANIIGDPSVVMWRTEAAEKTGNFDPSVVYCTDLEMWLRLLGEGDLYFSTTPVGSYRIHGNASARSLRGVAARDYLHMVHLLENRGLLQLYPAQRIMIAINAYLKGIVRQCLYSALGG